MLWNEVTISIISALFGGISLKIGELLTNMRKGKRDHIQIILEAYRESLEEKNKEIERLNGIIKGRF